MSANDLAALERERLIQTLRARLATLPPRRREALIRWAQGNDVAAVARQMGVSVKTADMHLQQARIALEAPPGVAGGRAVAFVLGRLGADA